MFSIRMLMLMISIRVLLLISGPAAAAVKKFDGHWYRSQYYQQVAGAPCCHITSHAVNYTSKFLARVAVAARCMFFFIFLPGSKWSEPSQLSGEKVSCYSRNQSTIQSRFL